MTIQNVTEREKLEKELLDSEKKYKNLFKKSPYPILIIKMDGTIVNYNLAFIKLLDNLNVNLINKNYKECYLIPNEYLPIFTKRIKLLKGGNVPEPLELNIIKENKEKIWIKLNFSLIELSGESFIYILIQDLTQLRRTEQEVRRLGQSLQEVEALIENAPLPIFLLDQYGKILRVNEKAIDLFGRREIDLLNLKIFNLFDRKFEKILKKHYFENIYDLRRPNKIETIIVRKDGKVIDVEITSSILKITDNIIIQSYFSDITERKSSEKHRQLLLDELLALVDFRAKFLATMSHELRTPLNAILGFSQLLLNEAYGALNKYQKDFLNDINSAGDHLLNLINGILDLSKLEAGKFKLDLERVNLRELHNEVISVIKPLYVKKKLEYKIEGIKKNDFLIADRLRFKQILYNLLSNAIKYTEKGKITLKGINRIDHWEFQIIDTGIGIAKKDYDIVFREFERVEDDKIRSIQGAGLGLALTKRLVNLHGGEIWFESELGKGTIFYFTIPKKNFNLKIMENRFELKNKEFKN
ncbi:MAG: PAS domain-containing sensor histidine kinase [Promethearchaeota archaeon]